MNRHAAWLPEPALRTKPALKPDRLCTRTRPYRSRTACASTRRDWLAADLLPAKSVCNQNGSIKETEEFSAPTANHSMCRVLAWTAARKPKWQQPISSVLMVHHAE